MAIPSDKQPSEFKRSTVTIPQELMPFAEARANEPQHAGNFSSYVRSLIIRDKQEAETQTPKPSAA